MSEAPRPTPPTEGHTHATGGHPTPRGSGAGLIGLAYGLFAAGAGAAVILSFSRPTLAVAVSLVVTGSALFALSSVYGRTVRSLTKEHDARERAEAARGTAEKEQARAQDERMLAAEGEARAQREQLQAQEARRRAEEAQRRAEEAQSRAQEAQAASELMRKQLDVYSRELARSNAELEQFAYVASHDLQEPLRMIASYVQLLDRRYQGQLDADADKYIRYAVDGATRMQRLINDLLAFSRVGTRKREAARVSLEAALDRTLGDLKKAIEETGANVTRGPLPDVVGDDQQIGQLLQNLIGNAIKFHGETPPRIHLAAERRDGEIEVSVRDNGIGIDPQFFQRIFIIFQRLHGPGRYPGTGIGLALCKKIVERHGGRIWVESPAGQGTTFRFTLPAAIHNEQPMEGATTSP
jgi:signal transduction histidine kinase